MKYGINSKGYYGNFGGAFIPEMLHSNVEELRINYLQIIRSKEFRREFRNLLKNYAGRPTPLYFAERLSAMYGAQIYLKREDLLHTGAHKINNTLGQILLARYLGKKRIIAETGAGQHGVATAAVCAKMGMECIIYMGQNDMNRQAPNVARMKMLGAQIVPVTSGSKTLKDSTNEAIRDWINHPTNTHYIIGSVVGPHPYPDIVLRFQSIISEEIKRQMKERPDYIIACAGGGSNAAGAFYHFLNTPSVKFVAVEAAGLGNHTGHSAATIALGKPGILHGSKTMLIQNDDGQITEPYSISAGLDYPGIGPLHAHLFETKRVRFVSVTDSNALEAAYLLARTEGIIPALESAHALAYLKEMNLKPSDKVIINLSGRGDKDLSTYLKFLP